MFINYAHRGASEYAPENTLAAFYMGQFMGANGIETDVQETADGFLVLFHDSGLERITGVKGSVSGFKYDVLLKMDFGTISLFLLALAYRKKLIQLLIGFTKKNCRPASILQIVKSNNRPYEC